MNVVYSSSEYYFKPTFVSIYSLLKNSNSTHHIYLLSSGVSEKNKLLLKDMVEKFGSTFSCVEIEELLKEKASKFGFPIMRGNYSTYARIFLSELLPNLDDVLLIDSDTLVTGDINEIKNSFPTDCMLACRDYVVSNRNSRHEDFRLSATEYFNMGVLFMNLSNWRKLKISEYLDEAYDRKKILKIADQTIINEYLGNQIKSLSLRFNFYTYFHYGFDFLTYKNLNNQTPFMEIEDFECMLADPIIIHFVGTWYERPWFVNNICSYADLYIKYWVNCFSIDELYATPKLSVRNFLYDNFSLFIYKMFGVKAYFLLRYKIIQLLKR